MREHEEYYARRYVEKISTALTGEVECFPALNAAFVAMLVYFIRRSPADKITVIDAINKDLRRELLKQAV